MPCPPRWLPLPSAGVATRCRACGAAVAKGVLRCRDCGADAREPAETRGVATGFALFDIAPGAAEAARLLDELHAIAPEVLSWWRSAPDDKRLRAAEILADLRRLSRRPK